MDTISSLTNSATSKWIPSRTRNVIVIVNASRLRLAATKKEKAIKLIA